MTDDSMRVATPIGVQALPDNQSSLADEETPDLPRRLPQFPVVCVGASAGGLSAFSKFLAGISVNTGMAFVLVQHLAPQHESQLAQILAKATRLPVGEAIHGTVVRPNHVYVIPPNVNMAIVHGILQMTPRETTHGLHLSIDFFMRSLALDRASRAIGIVMSGNGSDGTLGLAEIKSAGGITFAQNPVSAESGEMPASAIAYGNSDIVLDPAEIAHVICDMSRHAYLREDRAYDVDPFPDDHPSYSAVLAVLKDTAHIDFTLYRASTIKRRILRRMAIQNISALTDYARDLAGNVQEAQILLKDVLINVTSFFRDEVVFEAVKSLVFPQLSSDRNADSPIRILVVACSTGQEAYSWAIELIEHSERVKIHRPIQIFATDISEGSLVVARAGVYPASIEGEVSPERLKRHFVRVPEGYRVNKSIRDLCVFAKHDVIADTPFSKIDLISCRNVLIYLTPILQAQVIPTLCYSLNVGGFLVLGSTETIGQSTDLFDPLDAKNRVYVKKAGVGRVHPAIFTASRHTSGASTAAQVRSPAMIELKLAADRIVLDRYAPASVLVDGDLNIIQFRGKTAGILEPSQGQASLNLLKMVPSGLSQKLAMVIEEARRQNVTVRSKGICRREDQREHEIGFEVSPVSLPGSKDASILILFDEPESVETAAKVASAPTITAPRAEGVVSTTRDSSDYDRLLRDNRQLKQELATASGYLQSLIEQNNVVNDELRTASDETTSANEELRCTNEELQTAKEEVESANEELATLNEELRNRNHEISLTSDDLTNLLDGIDQPVLMLGENLRIRRISGPTAKSLRLGVADIGRHVSTLEIGFTGAGLEDVAGEVIATRTPKEVEVRDRSGRWYSMRVTPYRTEGDSVSGVVATFIDIDVLKRTQESLYRSYDTAKAIIETVGQPLIVLDAHLLVQRANRAFAQLIGMPQESILASPINRIGDAAFDIPELRRRLDGVLEGRAMDNVEVTHVFAHSGPRTLVLNARLLEGTAEGVRMIVLAIADVTDQKRLTDDLKRSAHELMRSNSELEQFAAIASHDLKEPLRMIINYTELLKKRLANQLDETSKEFMAFVIDGGRRMHMLIEAILTYSRVGHQGLNATLVSSMELARLAALNLERKIINAQAMVEFGILPPVHADPVLLTQLFQNLMSNGIKFRSKTRAPVITISGVAGDKEWIFTIADNGIGIHIEDTERIFMLFQRVHAASEYPGTGIGLATCKKIVERHGGRIWIESTLDVGTSFFFSLPMP